MGKHKEEIITAEILNTLALELYWAPWSYPSEWTKQQFENFLKTYKHPIAGTTINVDDIPSQIWQSKIFTVPTLLLLQNGEEIWRKAGLIDLSKIEERIELQINLETT